MRLLDCFVKPLAYTAYIVGISGDDSDNISAQQVTAIVRILLDESQKMAEHAGFSQQEYNEARFAVCAYIDEAILCSNWPERNIWLGELLQRRFYATNRAGEEFYTRMNNLESTSNQMRDVYYHCLALGFKGRYFSPEMEIDLEEIKKREYSKIKMENSILATSNLVGFFPESYPNNSAPRRRTLPRIALSYFTLFMILAPLLFLTLTYLSYNALLDGMLHKLVHLELK